MTPLRKGFLFFVVWIAFILPLRAQNDPAIQFFYTMPPNDDPVVYDGEQLFHLGARQAFIENVDLAQKTIEGSFYQINDPFVIEAFLRAVQRNVEVTLTSDDEWLESKGYAEAYGRLEAGGVQIIFDQRRALNHNKYCIFDRKRVWFGSTNITTQGSIESGDASFLIHDPDVAKIFLADFLQMKSGRFQTHKGALFFVHHPETRKIEMVLKGSALPDPEKSDEERGFKYQKITHRDFEAFKTEDIFYPSVQIGNAQMEFYFSPRHNLERRIVEEIYKAKESIYFSLFVLEDPMISNAILNKADRSSEYNVHPITLKPHPWEKTGVVYPAGEEGGMVPKVDVRGVFDWTRINYTPYVEMMDEAGLGLSIRKTAFQPGTLHHKFIMIDRKVLILGSYNFSQAAETDNDESMFIIRDGALVERFYEDVFRPVFMRAYPEYPPSEEELAEFSYARQDVAMTEIHFTPAQGESKSKFVEVLNYGDEPVDLTGWQLWNGEIPTHGDTGRRRGTTDILVSFWNDPYTNRYGLNHSEKGYFLKPGLQTLQPGEFGLVVGNEFNLAYLDPYLERYQRIFRAHYGREPVEVYERYPKLFRCVRPDDREIGDNLKARQSLALYYPDRFTVADWFYHNKAFLDSTKPDKLMLQAGQSLERIYLSKLKEIRKIPYENFHMNYSDENGGTYYWHGLDVYSDSEDWEPNQGQSATPGFAYQP